MKIVTILGARPQFIKAGSVSREICRQQGLGEDITEIIIHTGQHYDANMSEVFFDEMQIPRPNYYLGVKAKTHGAMTGEMIAKIEEVLVSEKPDWVMVYGDTNSTLAGAIAASKLNIPVAHVEAGLRSFNMQMPEEINRILTDRISSALFCPSQVALDNLTQEGVEFWKPRAEVVFSGDVMFDGAIHYKNLCSKPENVLIDGDYILCTIHRAENTDNISRLEEILAALNEIAKDRKVILPLHPRTKKLIETNSFDTSNLTIIEPVGYLNMVWLIINCSLVMTDSGGLQKEAYFFSKRCVVLRDETEWVELVSSGSNVLVGCNKHKIIEAASKNYNSKFDESFYGKGNACEIIVNYLIGK
ncbi:MAG: UDP-N-acetylglucosamine 2-epimerase (non-hydrolyzing) [Gammaproteobacteria bacterium]|nr:UDP-N-acetylglucosamine 2-epimerase (non-hydrolyzing) [Gammaproteobacteria bacterium]MBU2058445.1 UDP-N-acetylglucosamine 2-epimerase (non-hydrolyzing) [Gammaproteobacteria bacterium]MBU2176502.1 UDP-N-acetylglucosamine 2-epimerase (non-hydrolyzing) [Gammaproteobacteria bacterium]MBU2248556.1 UDP-N-acetylglucosamine 2-epimerase (non-hydrolyzing) [Gammaproteobacteria bacterium]MBU2345581.1 UDP-N-acetylglucosamine 2-epimerase (non-hydrolyzing) [Gammaproteobacteria bacterium]